MNSKCQYCSSYLVLFNNFFLFFLINTARFSIQCNIFCYYPLGERTMKVVFNNLLFHESIKVRANEEKI